MKLLLVSSRFPPFSIDKIMVFKCILLFKVILGDELFWLYDTLVTHTQFLDKICNLLALINFPKTESGTRGILKDTGGLS